MSICMDMYTLRRTSTSTIWHIMLIYIGSPKIVGVYHLLQIYYTEIKLNSINDNLTLLMKGMNTAPSGIYQSVI